MSTMVFFNLGRSGKISDGRYSISVMGSFSGNGNNAFKKLIRTLGFSAKTFLKVRLFLGSR
jgi:hypothetical protein